MEVSETYVPGMVGSNSPYQNPRMSKVNERVINSETSSVRNDVKESNGIKPTKPVVGFLYSISRGEGEYWPIYVGKNIIGRGEHCDIQLKEQTVSREHAVLVVRKMRTTGKIVASIRDMGSDVGMFLNDEELDLELHSCKNEDVILVGSCYKLVLILIDTAKYNLTVAEDFISVREEKAEAVFEEESIVVDERPMYRQPMGTVDLNGNRNINNPEKTSYL